MYGGMVVWPCAVVQWERGLQRGPFWNIAILMRGGRLVARLQDEYVLVAEWHDLCFLTPANVQYA